MSNGSTGDGMGGALERAISIPDYARFAAELEESSRYARMRGAQDVADRLEHCAEQLRSDAEPPPLDDPAYF